MKGVPGRRPLRASSRFQAQMVLFTIILSYGCNSWVVILGRHGAVGDTLKGKSMHRWGPSFFKAVVSGAGISGGQRFSRKHRGPKDVPLALLFLHPILFFFYITNTAPVLGKDGKIKRSRINSL